MVEVAGGDRLRTMSFSPPFTKFNARGEIEGSFAMSTGMLVVPSRLYSWGWFLSYIYCVFIYFGVAQLRPGVDVDSGGIT